MNKEYKFEEAIASLIPDSKACKNAISFLTLLTILGSVISLICSAYVAKSYSEFYGIHVNNLNILTTAKDMITIFGPFLLFLFIVRYIIRFAISNYSHSLSLFETLFKIIVLSLLSAFYSLFYGFVF